MVLRQNVTTIFSFFFVWPMNHHHHYHIQENLGYQLYDGFDSSSSEISFPFVLLLLSL